MSDLNHKPDISKSNDCPPLPDYANRLDKIVYWLGIGLGSGLPKKAPGTWGTVGGMLVGIPLMMLGFVPFLVITIIASVIGIWICDHTSKLMGVHDDPHIVWDEWAGIWIAMLPIAHIYQYHFITNTIPIGTIGYTLVIAFVLFRVFDILKPPPIRFADERVSGGFGIMLDDLIAGLMSATFLFLSIYQMVWRSALN